MNQNELPQYAALSLAVLCLAAGQILTKSGARQLRGESIHRSYMKYLKSRQLLAGAAITAVVPLAYTFALTRLSMGTAYAFTGLHYALVLAGCHWILDERISRQQILGCALLMLGFFAYRL